jgi:hypothetical protein
MAPKTTTAGKIIEAFRHDEAKYPVQAFRGSNRKYTDP